jgi:hypothetical protein
MKLLPMRFMGYEWHHNPREITFECEKTINENLVPMSDSEIQDTGRKNMLIKGVGELYGSDCLEQFEALLSLFKKGGTGVLSVEELEPVFAVFESVKLLGTPREDVLTYSFVFREVMSEKEKAVPCRHIAGNGETLWDISYKYGIVIDELVRLNPQVRRPDILTEGEEVRLC